MTAGQIGLLVILGVCILLSGFFSGSETAFVGIPRERVRNLADRDPRGRRLRALVDDIETTLGTLLVANNFVNILAASVATILAIDLVTAVTDQRRGEALGPWVATFVVTAVILVAGEITPKTLAARHPDRFALVVAPTIWALSRVLNPVARVFLAVSGRILRAAGMHRLPRSGATEADILALAVLGEEAGAIERAELDIIRSLFELADQPIRDVMTPRVEVIALEAGTTVAVAEEAMTRHRHSRFPVVAPGGSLDDIVGILYVKDLIGDVDPDRPIEEFVRDAHYLPESMSVLAALQQMRRRRLGFALVLDEHGGIDGIVTIKDLIAELVGEIQDEYDPKEPSTVRLGPTTWIVDGRVPVEDLADEIGVELPEGPYATVGGLYLAVTGRVPEVGDHADVNGIEMTVLKMDRRRIDRLRVELVDDHAAHGGSDGEVPSTWKDPHRRR